MQVTAIERHAGQRADHPSVLAMLGEVVDLGDSSFGPRRDARDVHFVTQQE
jgi:hypothetical protein